MIRRKVEIIAFERECFIHPDAPLRCPICQQNGEFLTVQEASRLAHVKPPSIRRWLREGKAHGLKTAGGGHRICRHSLFRPLHSRIDKGQLFPH